MAQAGGSATINGVLYQILGALQQSLSYRIVQAEIRDGDFQKVSLLIEPSGGGGDLQIFASGFRTVQQWKAKSTGGTWSLKEVIEEVLPDLYRSVSCDQLEEGWSFQFVTEGRIGKWEDAYAFFQTLPASCQETNLQHIFPNSKKRHKLGRKVLSDKQLFVLICNRLRSEGEDRFSVRKKVLFLLSHFKLVHSVSPDQLIARINSKLSLYVDLREEVDNKRRQLCGILLEIGSEGNRLFTAESLMQSAMIPLQSFDDWPRLKRRMDERLRERLKAEQYASTSDVRETISISGMTVIHGESGQGKTWCLARAALTHMETDAIVIWVPNWSKSPVEEFVRDELWSYGLQRDSHLHLSRVVEKVRKTETRRWLVVCIDDVQAADLPRIVHGEWGRWGIDLGVSMNSSLLSEISLRDQARMIKLRDFTLQELRKFFELNHLPWATTSWDLLQLLRHPFLAGLFARVSRRHPGFDPSSEYELMDAAWDPLQSTGFSLLRSLLKLESSDPTHRWTLEEVHQVGGSTSSVENLTGAGWLRHSGEGTVMIPHSRFFCWAYAKFLVFYLKQKQLGFEEFCTTVTNCFFGQNSRNMLGYVPMDVLWLLLKEGAPLNNNTWRLIERFESHSGIGHEDQILYQNLIATLGDKVVPALLLRVENIGGLTQNAVTTRVAEAIKLIASREPQVAEIVVPKCVNSFLPSLQELGLRLTHEFPKSASADDIWRIYCGTITSHDDVAMRLNPLARKALLRIAPHSAEWLRTQILAESIPSHLDVLAFALSEAAGNECVRAIWLQVKEHLFSNLPPGERGSIAACISNFSDECEYERLESLAYCKDKFDGRDALWALAYRRPERVLDILCEVPSSQLFWIVGYLGTAIFATGNPDISEKVLEHLRLCPNRWHDVLAVIAPHSDQLEEPALAFMLDMLNKALSSYLSSPSKSNHSDCYNLLEYTQQLSGNSALKVLNAAKSTSLEENLVSYSKKRAATRIESPDYPLRNAVSLLKKIGGDGFASINNLLLVSHDPFQKLEACRMSVVLPNSDTRELLHDIVMSDELWQKASEPVNYVQRIALDCLAALGENESLVQGVLKWGFKSSEMLVDLREGQPAMTDNEIAIALDSIESTQSELQCNAILAIGLSGRTEFAEKLWDIYQKVEFQSPVAEACLVAFSWLELNCEQHWTRLVSQYKSGHHKWRVLANVNSKTSSSTILASLVVDVDELDDADKALVRFLSRDQGVRPLIEHQVRKLLTEQFFFDDTIELLDLYRKEDVDALWEKSHNPYRGFHVSGAMGAAVRRLGEIEAEAAFDVGLQALQSHGKDMEHIVPALLQINLPKAIEELCELIRGGMDKQLCSVVGRNFRRFASCDDYSPEIKKLLKDEDWLSRRAGALLCSYLGSDPTDGLIKKLAYADARWEVCFEAHKTIRAFQKENEAKKMVASLLDTDISNVWGKLDYIVALVDPYILTQPGDPIGLRNALANFPRFVQVHADELIRRSRDKLKRDANSFSGKWSD